MSQQNSAASSSSCSASSDMAGPFLAGGLIGGVLDVGSLILGPFLAGVLCFIGGAFFPFELGTCFFTADLVSIPREGLGVRFLRRVLGPPSISSSLMGPNSFEACHGEVLGSSSASSSSEPSDSLSTVTVCRLFNFLNGFTSVIVFRPPVPLPT
uniref:Uncharacterized protein n=1 Tax=Opuntia streptacantha TaxID=393608 RepID=A0A7C9APJ2_OPUST